MATSSFEKDLFPVDLVQKSKEHVAFLKSLHRQGVTIHRPSSKSLQRYRDRWLPLVYGNSHEQLVPPADCAWLWHCHRLAPFRYASYLRSQFGSNCQILEANPPFVFQFDEEEVCCEDEAVMEMRKAAETTRILWNQHYPQEPFFLSQTTDVSCDEKKEESSDSLLVGGFDLLGSTDRQATFLWQISNPHFADDAFLHEGQRQYHKFLRLRKKAIGTKIVLVPTFQIDLMWHTHILSSVTGYFMDCKSIIGEAMNHDDNMSDRSVDGPLDRAFKHTKELWRGEYGEDYFAEGGMYRGEPPQSYYSTSWNASDEMEVDYPQLGAFLHMIGLQGASSSNPPTGGAYDLQVLWAWKETDSQMFKHATDHVVGDPADCWIKYEGNANLALESAFQGQGGEGSYDLGNGYKVDFITMIQTNMSTGFQREVQRHVSVVSTTTADEKPKVWCWKETPSQMYQHDPSTVYGDPADCWIKYDDLAIAKLESAFEAQGSNGEISPSNGYMVNFATMKQARVSTGYVRDVQRVDAILTSNATVHCWTSVNGTAPDGSPGFIPMKPTKSKAVRVKFTNPKKKDYIFGK
eukprot:scaffold25800_cov162-Cylindrotheca_fusiformis.AAC.1